MPHRTELDNPSARRGLTAKITLNPSASIRRRAECRGTTTMILPGANPAASVSVLRSKLIARTPARAFGRPKREENPAARMITCSPGRVTAFIAIIV